VTQLALLVRHGTCTVATRSVVWCGAALGIVLKLVRNYGLHALTGALYIALGWMAVLAMPEIIRGISAPAVGLLFSGGVLYTAGAVVLARNRPDPIPSTYGYHEIWHSCVIAATACHYSLILMITLGAR